MKLKLDENIGRRGIELLLAEGHDVTTVRDQSLEGTMDEVLFEVCVRERRTLVTLDHDFGQVLRFPPERSAGIVILEPGRRATVSAIISRLRAFSALARDQSPVGALWIVEAARIRIHLREYDSWRNERGGIE